MANMADTKDFDVIRVCRSDGADTGPGYWPPVASVTTIKKTATAEKTPRAKPQMSRLSEDDPRFTEWRVKLGILLKQELAPNPDEGNAWYVQFPRGYWLYEKSKHLWVSGYPIKSKLFKSPQEFALHLIWLLSSSKDYKNCCCIHCNVVPSLPKQIQSASADDAHSNTRKQSPIKSDDTKPPSKMTPVPLPPFPGQQTKATQKSSAQNSKAPPVSAPKSSVPQQTPAAVPSHSHPQPKPQPKSQPKSQSQSQSQPQAQAQNQSMAWSLHSPLLFRVGELVWYQNGNTWRLGVVAAYNGSQAYELLALGHGNAALSNVGKVVKDMRPFYAFSVPGVSIPELKNLTYDGVFWDQMFQSVANDVSRRDHLALDASKMAASKIDYSYSFWSRLKEDPQTKTTSFYGCFFGAERIEIGDSLRLKSLQSELNFSAGAAIMGIRGVSKSGESSQDMLFHGPIYMLIKGDTSSPAVVPEGNLPIALRDEYIWRNQVSPTSRWRYVLLKENATVQEHQVRGRFYPTHRLMPIMNPQGFQEALQLKTTDDLMPHLNNRMDGVGRVVGQKKNRIETLGPAVAHTSKLLLEGYVREEL